MPKVDSAGIVLIVFLPLLGWAEAQPSPADQYSAQIKFVPQQVATVHSYPVYAIGDVDIYAVSPDFSNTAVIQAGNDGPRTKIVPKTSRQLRSNYIGATPPRLPRSEVGEEYPFRAIHLIDDDPETYWRCRPSLSPGQEPAWIRLDFPTERSIVAVELSPVAPREKTFGYQDRPSPAFPVDFKIQISRNATDWETVYTATNYPKPEGTPMQVFRFEARPAKQIRLLIMKLTQVPGDDGRDPYCVSLAEMKVLDTGGSNVALASRGTGVVVSSTDYGYPTKREVNNLLWPIHYDLGVKWLKVGYFMDRLNWYQVERVKSHYYLDPVTDAALTEACRNGIEIVLTLCYGNPLYQAYGYEGRQKGFWEIPYTGPLRTPEAIEAYAKYCQFMVDHFRGRVCYFEVWNNPDGEFGLEPDPQLYAQTVLAAAKRIKQINPEAKIVLGGMSLMKLAFFRACFECGLAPLLDVLAWHPYQLALMPEECYEPGFKSYADWVAALRKMASGYGFKGELHANEVTYAAAYPQNKERPVRPDWNYDVTELTKAKFLARLVFLHAGLDIPVFWNETWNDQHIYRDVGLLRNTVSADPQNPLCPQAAYYVLRTCATVLDGVKPANMEVEISPTLPEIQTYVFKNADQQDLIAMWLARRAPDDFSGQEINLTLPIMDGRRVIAIDTLNGRQQELKTNTDGTKTRIPKLIVKDYPLVLRLEPKNRARCASLW